jgi:hypothetical protein
MLVISGLNPYVVLFGSGWSFLTRAALAVATSSEENVNGTCCTARARGYIKRIKILALVVLPCRFIQITCFN